jgi:hypothetical protein
MRGGRNIQDRAEDALSWPSLVPGADPRGDFFYPADQSASGGIHRSYHVCLESPNAPESFKWTGVAIKSQSIAAQA